jgi:hypothetical protein
MGNQIISRYRSGLTPLLTPSETEMYAMESILRMNTRKDYESKLGKPIYSFTIYQKLKRVTITLNNNIITTRILPMVNAEGLGTALIHFSCSGNE